MELFYTHPIIITDNRVVQCKELTYKHYIAILKLINSKNYTCLYNYFNLLVSELCTSDYVLNCMDKFIIILNIRTKSIGSFIDLAAKGGTKLSVDLKYIIQLIQSNYHEKTKRITGNNYDILCGYPVNIQHVYTVYDYIRHIVMDNINLDLATCSKTTIEEIHSSIPLNVIKHLDYYDHLNQYPTIELFKIPKTDQSFKFSYNLSEVLSILKMVFDNTVDSALYEKYICCEKLHIPAGDFDNSSISDIKRLIKFYTDEYRKKEPTPGG